MNAANLEACEGNEMIRPNPRMMTITLESTYIQCSIFRVVFANSLPRRALYQRPGEVCGFFVFGSFHMATSSQKVAQRLDSLYSDRDIYYRFDVSRGLEDVTLSDWKKTSQISAHTRNYLAASEKSLVKCSSSLQQGHLPTEAAASREDTVSPGES